MVVNEHRCAVLGQPIAHSLSPVLHNAAYRALDLTGWTYGRHEVGEDGLDAFLKGLDPTWAGLSLTMPLKRTIQPYGTPRNLWAKELGVANTVVFDWLDDDAPVSAASDAPVLTTAGGHRARLRLFNTDVIGIQLAFEHAKRERNVVDGANAKRERTALVIGNGNTAASAVAAATMMHDVGHVIVAARHPGRNTSLKPVAERFISAPTPYREIDLNDQAALLAAAAEASYVISTIPGRAADATADLIANEHQNQDALTGLLLDVVYDPRPTKLMQAWRQRGGSAIGGEEMLLYQALVQVLLMTGEWDGMPPSDADQRLQDVTTDDDKLEIAMRQALEEAL